MRRKADVGGRASLELRVEFRCGADDEGLYLMVETSAFGLWIRAAEKARPAVRIEYDRQAHSKAAAHVHIHAESTEMGWLYGSAGRSLERMEELHFPLGGRRFRPTIEDFLVFIDRENLFTDWVEPGWRQNLERPRDELEDRQARATVRRYPNAAADQSSRIGYTVTSPSTPA